MSKSTSTSGSSSDPIDGLRSQATRISQSRREPSPLYEASVNYLKVFDSSVASPMNRTKTVLMRMTRTVNHEWLVNGCGHPRYADR